MYIRTRRKDKPFGVGSTTIHGQPPSVHDVWNGYDIITDVVGKGDGGNLDIIKRHRRGGLVNSRLTGSPTASTVLWQNALPTGYRISGSSRFDHLKFPGRPTNPMLAAKLLAETNPSRPVVDLPIFVYELREIPQLLKREGDGWVRKLASLNLKYQFGIKPLVNDLVSLLAFSDEVAKREKELNALASSGLRRKRTLWSDSMVASELIYVNTGSGFNTGQLPWTRATTSRIWGHVTWTMDNPALMKGDLRALAKRAVLGMTVDFSTAWNAMPWSWLIDWCSNIGDILIANRNIVGASPGDVLIMEHSTTNSHVPAYSRTYSSHITQMDELNVRHETKTRRRVSPTLSAQLPILSVRQLSILGSIGVTRRVPRSS